MQNIEEKINEIEEEITTFAKSKLDDYKIPVKNYLFFFFQYFYIFYFFFKFLKKISHKKIFVVFIFFSYITIIAISNYWQYNCEER